ncbi:MAG: Gfo/Idh/MocA family oxidoreductase [Cucumibacter sp.]
MSAKAAGRAKPVRVLILGTGNMGNHHAKSFASIRGVTLAGAVDVDRGRVEAFRDAHGVERAFTSLEAALDWGKFDAVANVTPDALHHSTTMKVIAAGKHILGEKPLATNYADAMEMTQAAERAGLVAMVNLSYRNVAELHAARALIEAGKIGEVKHIEASYLQSWLVAKSWGNWRTEATWLWRLSTKHGSHGALGDIGIHILDFTVYGAGLDISKVYCRHRAFDKAPGNKIGEYNLDANDSFTMALEFGNGALGIVHASRWATGYLNSLRLRVFGDKGAVEVNHATDGSSLRACTGRDVHTQTWREVKAKRVESNHQRFIAAVREGKGREPSFRHAAALQRVLDLGGVANADRTEHRVG